MYSLQKKCAVRTRRKCSQVHALLTFQIYNSNATDFAKPTRCSWQCIMMPGVGCDQNHLGWTVPGCTAWFPPDVCSTHTSGCPRPRPSGIRHNPTLKRSSLLIRLLGAPPVLNTALWNCREGCILTFSS